MGMADGYAQATGRPRGGQRARAAGARQRDVGDPERRPRPGAAARDRGPAGAGRCSPRSPSSAASWWSWPAPWPRAPGRSPDPDDLPEPSARGACARRREPPRGPVVLEPPARRAGRAGPAAARPGRRPPPPPPPDAAAARPGRGAAGRRPRPGGAGRRRAWPAPARRPTLAALAERLGAPIFGEPLARHGPPAHRPPPLARPAAGLRGRDRARSWPRTTWCSPWGCRCSASSASSPGQALPPGTALVHLEVDPHEVGKVHAPAVGLVGDVARRARGPAASAWARAPPEARGAPRRGPPP